ncbi:paraquat-inducible protein A [Sulfurovum sp.]|uniref:paraquat-inducible protein A n=1 Tax=Sulfurovum sp. TaxID=1969726 RepID=UPI0028682C54|nr:paraquat-inducible protein A [Sulfurovum sp.]
MEIENEDALDHYIICHRCHALHKEVPMNDGAKAHCIKCGAVLYRSDSKLVEHGLALSITGFVFFVLANAFPLVRIEILGLEQFITIPKTFMTLFESGFYIVGLICALLIFVFPFMIFSINILLFTLFKIEKGEKISKELLILLSHIKPWSMGDIFLISILVALVKLIGYAQIHMGISFWALILFVLLDLYLTKTIHVSQMWMLRKRIFLERKEA